MKNITVLVSGGGTNFQALIDNIENGFIENGRIALHVLVTVRKIFSCSPDKSFGLNLSSAVSPFSYNSVPHYRHMILMKPAPLSKTLFI